MSFLLFDFDGVVVDTFEISYQSSLEEPKKDFSRDEYRTYFHGNIFDHLEVEDGKVREEYKPSEKDVFFTLYIPRLLETPPVVGMREVLSELSTKHTLVIVSSTINSPIQAYLDRYDLAQYFDTVFGADVHKSKVVKIQMAMTMYSAAADQCTFITDTLGDIREANKAGIKSIGVTWGFHSVDTLQEGHPLSIATTPQELLQLISTHTV